MDKEELLSCFQRYRRACQSCSSDQWDQNTIAQWEEDRIFLRLEYSKNRHINFSFASDQAHEQLFLRCCGVTE